MMKLVNMLDLGSNGFYSLQVQILLSAKTYQRNISFHKGYV